MGSPGKAWNLRSMRGWDEEPVWETTAEQYNVKTLLAQRRFLEERTTSEKAKLRNEAESTKKQSLHYKCQYKQLKVQTQHTLHFAACEVSRKCRIPSFAALAGAL